MCSFIFSTKVMHSDLFSMALFFYRFSDFGKTILGIRKLKNLSSTLLRLDAFGNQFFSIEKQETIDLKSLCACYQNAYPAFKGVIEQLPLKKIISVVEEQAKKVLKETQDFLNNSLDMEEQKRMLMYLYYTELEIAIWEKNYEKIYTFSKRLQSTTLQIGSRKIQEAKKVENDIICFILHTQNCYYLHLAMHSMLALEEAIEKNDFLRMENEIINVHAIEEMYEAMVKRRVKHGKTIE